MQRAVEAARAAEKATESLAVSVFAGFSLVRHRGAVHERGGRRCAVARARADHGRAHRARRSGASAKHSSTAASRWPTSIARAKELAQARDPARCCCSTMATTACRAAPATPWTCCRKRWRRGSTASASGRCAIRRRSRELIAAGEGATVDGRTRQQGRRWQASASRKTPLQLTGTVRAHQRRRVRDHRSDLHGPARQHGPHGAVRHRRGTHRRDRAHAGAAGTSACSNARASIRAASVSCSSSRACTAGRCSSRCRPRWSSATAAGVTSSDYGLFPFSQGAAPGLSARSRLSVHAGRGYGVAREGALLGLKLHHGSSVLSDSTSPLLALS